MQYEFEVYQMKVEEHLFWVAKSKSLKGCVGQGETAQEAIDELELNEAEWLTTAHECGIPIPASSVRSENSYSGKVSLRFSAFTHEEASKNARETGVSLNQYINDAIVYYNGLLRAKQNFDNTAGTEMVETTDTKIINFSDYSKRNYPYKISIDPYNLEEM